MDLQRKMQVPLLMLLVEGMGMVPPWWGHHIGAGKFDAGMLVVGGKVVGGQKAVGG